MFCSGYICCLESMPDFTCLIGKDNTSLVQSLQGKKGCTKTAARHTAHDWLICRQVCSHFLWKICPHCKMTIDVLNFSRQMAHIFCACFLFCLCFLAFSFWMFLKTFFSVNTLLLEKFARSSLSASADLTMTPNLDSSWSVLLFSLVLRKAAWTADAQASLSRR